MRPAELHLDGLTNQQRAALMKLYAAAILLAQAQDDRNVKKERTPYNAAECMTGASNEETAHYEGAAR